MIMDYEKEGERRKKDQEFGEKLTRIEAILEFLKEQIVTQFDGVKHWQQCREAACEKVSEALTQIKIEQATFKVKIAVGSFILSSVVAAVIAYFIKA